MNKNQLIEILKEIESGKDGQMIPYDIILKIENIRKAYLLEDLIYILERLDD